MNNRDDPAPEAPDHPRRAAVAGMVEQAAALIRAGYFADAARVMRTAVDLVEVPAGEADVVPIGAARRRQ